MKTGQSPKVVKSQELARTKPSQTNEAKALKLVHEIESLIARTTDKFAELRSLVTTTKGREEPVNEGT
jgi:hypothetical protein